VIGVVTVERIITSPGSQVQQQAASLGDKLLRESWARNLLNGHQAGNWIERLEEWEMIRQKDNQAASEPTQPRKKRDAAAAARFRSTNGGPRRLDRPYNLKLTAQSYGVPYGVDSVAAFCESLRQVELIDPAQQNELELLGAHADVATQGPWAHELIDRGLLSLAGADDFQGPRRGIAARIVSVVGAMAKGLGMVYRPGTGSWAGSSL